MALPSPEQARTWGGKLIVDRTGAPIGTITQIYSDNATGLPEWATTRLGEATVFLPLLDAVEADGQVRVLVKRDDVAKAPLVGPGRRITEQEEARLYGHYGIDYTPERSASGLPRGVGPVPSRAQLLLRRARGLDLEVVPLALAGAFTAAAVLVAVLGLRRGSHRSRREAALSAAAVVSSEAARAARRAPRAGPALRAPPVWSRGAAGGGGGGGGRPAGTPPRKAAAPATAAGAARDEAPRPSRGRRGRNPGHGRGSRHGRNSRRGR